MRYIFELVDKDYSLTDGMIPLGSYTMKLNASSQLEPLGIMLPIIIHIHQKIL